MGGREGGRERERERERERNKESIFVKEKHRLIGTQPGLEPSASVGMCPDWGWNLLCSGVWDDAPTN